MSYPQQPWPPQDQPYGQQPGQWPPQQPYQPYQPYGAPGGRIPPAGPPPRRPRKKHHWIRNIFAGIGALVVLIVIISAVASKGSGTAAPASSAPATVAAKSSAPAKTAAARTVATFTGSGEANTRRFTVTATWKLIYSFNCSAFGSSGNFQVFEDGGSDFNGVSVNDLAMSKSSSTWGYDDAGTHYLQVNSECSWKMKVVDEP